MRKTRNKKRVLQKTIITYKGQDKTAFEWYNDYIDASMSWQAFKARLEQWPLKKAMETPPMKYNTKATVKKDPKRIRDKELFAGIRSKKLQNILINGDVESLLKFDMKKK